MYSNCRSLRYQESQGRTDLHCRWIELNSRCLKRLKIRTLESTDLDCATCWLSILGQIPLLLKPLLPHLSKGEWQLPTSLVVVRIRWDKECEMQCTSVFFSAPLVARLSHFYSKSGDIWHKPLYHPLHPQELLTCRPQFLLSSYLKERKLIVTYLKLFSRNRWSSE